MDSRAALKLGINGAGNVSEQYLSDLTDADLLVRPVPGANHIAWQLGHLIQAENWMVMAPSGATFGSGVATATGLRSGVGVGVRLACAICSSICF